MQSYCNRCNPKSYAELETDRRIDGKGGLYSLLRQQEEDGFLDVPKRGLFQANVRFYFVTGV